MYENQNLLIKVDFVGLFGFGGKKSPIDALLDERRRVSNELAEAERNFLRHKIDKPTFDAISRERNSDLIRVEAEIDAHKHTGLGKEELKAMENVSSDKRKIISGLLEEKQKKVYELKLAESSYLKRKISEEVFQKISSEVKKEKISIDSQIKSIQDSEEISHLKANLKAGAMEVARQEKLSDERKKQDYFEEMEEEIFEQAKSILPENKPSDDSPVPGPQPQPAPQYEDSEKNIPRRLRRRQ